MNPEKRLEQVLTMTLIDNKMEPKIEPGLTWNQAAIIAKHITKIIIEAREIIYGRDNEELH